MGTSLGFGPSGVDWQERVNFNRMREQRAERTRIAMKKHGIPAILLYSNDNIRYTTALRGPGTILPYVRYVLFFAEHEPIVYEHAGTYHQNKFHCPWIKPENMRCAYSWLGGICGADAARDEAKKWADAIKSDLKERGLENEKLGVDMIDSIGREALADGRISVTDAGQVMVEARVIKTEDEVNCLRMAAAFADVAWRKMYEVMKTGVMEREIAAAGMEALFKIGAEGVISIAVKSGPNTFEDYRGCNPTDRIIQSGDLLTVDTAGVSYLGYRTCYYRTFIVGRKPNEKEKTWYKRTRDWIYTALEEVKPGATTADAAAKFPPASTWNYSSEEEVLCTILGHGIGLSLYEQPTIARLFSLKHPQVFEKGMTFAIETLDGEPFVGGTRLENMVVVTDTGYELLTRMPDEEIIVVDHSLFIK